MDFFLFYAKTKLSNIFYNNSSKLTFSKFQSVHKVGILSYKHIRIPYYMPKGMHISVILAKKNRYINIYIYTNCGRYVLRVCSPYEDF